VAAAVARGLHVTQDPHARAWLISSDATITHALKESFHRAERRALRLHRCNILGAMRTSTTHVLRSMYTTLITVILSPAHTGVLTMIHSMWIFGSYIGSGLLAAQYVLAKSGSSSLRTLQWGFTLLGGTIWTAGRFLSVILAFVLTVIVRLSLATLAFLASMLML
jgi:hypothetical protein